MNASSMRFARRRTTSAAFPILTPAPELLGLAAQILDSKLAAFDPSGFRDRYEEALMAHLQAKQAGMPPQPKRSWAVPRRAINLMEALRRSIASDTKAEAAQRAVRARLSAKDVILHLRADVGGNDPAAGEDEIFAAETTVAFPWTFPAGTPAKGIAVPAHNTPRFAHIGAISTPFGPPGGPRSLSRRVN